MAAQVKNQALGLTAAGMDALGLYAALLAVVDAKELVAGHMTVGLVQELVQRFF